MNKKLLVILSIILLAGCGSRINQSKDMQVDNKEEVSQEVLDKTKEDKTPKINRTYPEKEKVKKEVIAVEKEDKNKEKDKNESKEDSANNNKKEDKENESQQKAQKEESSEDKLSKDDIFFSYYDLVKIEDDKLVSVINKDKNEENIQSTSQYIPYSNNMTVIADNINYKSSIKKINQDKLTLIYDFKKGESFYPLGLIDNKIYGIYSFNTTKEDGSIEYDSSKGVIAVVDLDKGELNNFTKTAFEYGMSLNEAVVTDKQVLFLRLNDKNLYNLYSLNLKKDFDQEPELVEEDLKINQLYAAKHFEADKAIYDVLRADGEFIYTKDNKYPYSIQSGAQVIGENLFILGYAYNPEAENKYEFQMSIINYMTGQTLLEDTKTSGYRVYKGKLYYIDENNKIQELDIKL